MEAVTVGLDLGTSALKVSVYSLEQQQVIKNINVKYKGEEIAPGISQLQKYTSTIIETLSLLDEEYAVASVALSTQMYSFIVMENGEKLVYQWNVPWKTDNKIEEILAKYVSISGCPIDSLFPAYKILSSKLSGPFLNIQPYGLQEAVVQELTGVLAGDYCTISSYGFMNVLERKWNTELLELAGFQQDQMPKLYRYNDVVGPITNPDVKSKQPIQLACGLGDGPSASYASKDISNVAANIGTSMAVRGFVKSVDRIDFSSVWTFAVDETTWVSGGISSNGSSVLDHYRNNDMLKDWEIKTAFADNKILYYPWLHGERTPYWSSKLKETMLGGTMESTKNDYMSAVFRGIAYTIATMYIKISPVIEDDDTICVAGGGAYSEILMHYLSGALPVKLAILQDFDFLGSYGAAYVAAEAIGKHPKRNQNLIKIYLPTHQYDENYTRWLRTARELATLYKSSEE